jgi:hypothetical protein
MDDDRTVQEHIEGLQDKREILMAQFMDEPAGRLKGRRELGAGSCGIRSHAVGKRFSHSKTFGSRGILTIVA